MSAAAPPATRVDAVVIGAGLAGLAAAATLRRAGHEVRLLEAGAFPGGVVRSERVGGYLLEHGPNTLRISGPARAAVEALDLAPLLVPAAAANRLRFLFHEGQLVPLPDGPLAAATTPLVSLSGKLRILAEPFVGRGDPTGESVAEFVGRRLGPEAASRLVGPFLTGVYAGDERQLGAEAVFPSLVEAERRSGSIARGLLAGRRTRAEAPAALPGIHSCLGGLGDLPARLASDLGEIVAFGSPVAALAREAAGVRVEPARGEGALVSERVILATPAHAAAALLRDFEPTAAEALAGIDHAPLAVVHLGVDPADLRHAVEGFGFLVPRAAELHLLGCLFMSNLFAGRAPRGRALLTCLVGGTRWRECVDAGDDALRHRIFADLDATCGLRGEPEVLRIVRWRHAVPQPGTDHPRVVAEIARRLRERGVLVAGAWVAGVSAADTLASGVAAARRLLEGRAA